MSRNPTKGTFISLDDDWIVIVKNNNHIFSNIRCMIAKKSYAPLTIQSNPLSIVNKEFENELLYGNDPGIIEQLCWAIDDMLYAMQTSKIAELLIYCVF